MLNRRPPVPRINRPSAPAVNPSPFMNTDISPQEGKYVGVASPFMSAVYSQSWSQNVVLCFLFFFFFSFQFYFFLVLLIFFSQKDFMVCYFNFLNSYSENGMLSFWLLFPKTIIITFMCIVLSRALPHKNSESEEMDSCLDSIFYFLCDLGRVAWPFWVLVSFICTIGMVTDLFFLEQRLVWEVNRIIYMKTWGRYWFLDEKFEAHRT